MRRSWTQSSPIGDLVIVVGHHGIITIAWGDQRPDAGVGAVPERDERIAERLDRWFRGEIDSIDVEVDLTNVQGFKRDVLETLRKEVGRGETVSYGELAAMAGRPGAARAVGTIMAGNPLPFVIPCHRVIAAGGRIGGYGGTAASASANLDIKRTLLRSEGITVKG